jgi:hypothetical protein
VDEAPEEIIKLLDRGRKRREPKYSLLLSKKYQQVKEKEE